MVKVTVQTMITASLFAAVEVNLHAQVYRVLHNFTGSPADGSTPVGGLALFSNTLYGTTYLGGSANNGTVFSVGTEGGRYKILHSFTPNTQPGTWTNMDGAIPEAGMIISGNLLYGTTSSQGTNGLGTVFATDTNGNTFTTLCSFGANDGPGGGPVSDLLLSDGTLYGTTVADGGTVFSISTNGANYTTLYWFQPDSNSNYTNGEYPVAGLVLSSNVLYGTTKNGGTNDNGTIFSINSGAVFPVGAFNVLHQFSAVDASHGFTNWDGRYPKSDLVASGGMLYGTAQQGGMSSDIYYADGLIFSINMDGSGFTVLHYFDNPASSDGLLPVGAPVLAGDTLYGVTEAGGGGNSGTLFSMNTNGSNFTTLYSFTNGFGTPYAGLTLSGCTLYGTTTTTAGKPGGAVFSFALLPGIAGCRVAETNLLLNATNGVANCAYTVLTTTNLASPLNQWTPLVTNVFARAGDFNFTLTNAVDPKVPPRFYTVRAQ